MYQRPCTRLLFIALLALAPGPARAQVPAVEPAVPETAPVSPHQEAFTNLPKEQRDQFTKHLTEASKLFAEKRIFECIDELTKAEQIFPDSAVLENIKGSCYVEFRDFDRARAIFNRALELAPDTPTILFNLAEVDFCSKQWQAAEQRFQEVLGKLDARQVAMSRLIEFKILLCKIRAGQVEQARKLVDKYGFMDDSPYHFFAQAALAFHDDDPVSAEEWLGRAMRIFRAPGALAPWQDTLIEFGYIKSFYGGDLGEE